MKVDIKLNSQTRTVEIYQAPNGLYFAEGKPIVCKFKTGSKLHAPENPQVIERFGVWTFPSQVVNNRHIFPVAWNDDLENSGWTKK